MHNIEIMKKAALLSFSLLVLLACNNSGTMTGTSSSTVSDAISSVIERPLENIKDNTLHFTVKANEPTTLTAPSGSRIIIPENAFVDQSGKPITGDIDIAFEEFHSSSDIILSGIPMNITSENGDMGVLESAGMFRLEGEQNGKEVYVAEDKTLEIQLASFKEGNDYNFYEFSEESANWIEKGRTEPVANAKREAALAELGVEPIQPIEIKKASSEDFVFDLRVDQARNPEFSYFDNVLWKLAEEKTDKALFNENIRNPELECVDANRSVFRLNGKANGKAVQALVTPVLFGSSWQKAQSAFKEKMSAYQAAKKSRDEQLKSLDKMALVQRSFSINNFGLFNFDRISKLKRRVELRALFFVPAIKKILNRAYLIQGKDKIAIPYTFSPSFPFMFDPKAENHLITFDEDGNLYEFTSDDFENADFKNYNRSTEFTFRMRETDVIIDDQYDLDDYIASL